MMQIVKIAKNMNLQVIVKELVMSKSGILEILSKSQSIRNVLNQPNYDRLRKLQHRIIRKLIRTAISSLTDKQLMDECDFLLVNNTKCILQEWNEEIHLNKETRSK